MMALALVGYTVFTGRLRSCSGKLYGRTPPENEHRLAVAGFPCYTTVRTGSYTAVRLVERLPVDEPGKSERVKVSVGQRHGEGQ